LSFELLVFLRLRTFFGSSLALIVDCAGYKRELTRLLYHNRRDIFTDTCC